VAGDEDVVGVAGAGGGDGRGRGGGDGGKEDGGVCRWLHAGFRMDGRGGPPRARTPGKRVYHKWGRVQPTLPRNEAESGESGRPRGLSARAAAFAAGLGHAHGVEE